MGLPIESLIPAKKAPKKSIDFQLGKDSGPPSVDYLLRVPSVEATNKVQVSLGPGLYNLGNTCFMNSSLQCLFHIPQFRSACTSQLKNHKCKPGFCLLCLVKNHASRISNDRKPFAPKGFANNLKNIAKHFRLGRQEDAHEFLRFIIDGLDEGLKPSKLIGNMFGGAYLSQVKCLSCKNISSTRDPIMDISLDIKNCNSLVQALKMFVTPESLCKENQYRCEKCARLRDAQKGLVLESCPPVLVVHLKRFDSFSRFSDKITRHIKFDEHLDLEPYLAESSKENGKSASSYKLSGVLVHAGGSCRSGHYFSFVKPNPYGPWYRMDDEEVMQVDTKKVLGQSAYVLFYSLNEKDRSVKAVDPPKPLAPKVEIKEVKPIVYTLNSTRFWSMEKKETLQPLTNGVNSTLKFHVQPNSKVDIGVSSSEKAIPENIDDIFGVKALRVQPVSSVEQSSKAIDVKPTIPKPSKDIDYNRQVIPTISKSEPVFDISSFRSDNGVKAWDMVDPSVIAKRQSMVDGMKQKRKRASKEDMEYDAPRRKGPKNNKKSRYIDH